MRHDRTHQDVWMLADLLVTHGTRMCGGELATHWCGSEKHWEAPRHTQEGLASVVRVDAGGGVP